MSRNDILIEANELMQAMDDPALRLFDATVFLAAGPDDLSARDKYNEGHIPGAAFLDHASLSDGSSDYMFMIPDETALAEAIGKLGISNDSRVVVYASESIMWATRVYWVLTYAGHRNVRVLNGGLGAWLAAGGDTSTEPALYPEATFTTSLSPSMIAGKDEVVAAMEDGGVCTINALPHSFYTGEADVPYAKMGHITGSISHPFSDLLDNEHYLDDETLKARLAEKTSEARVITYCGGGIAATVNAVALVLAGHSNVGVYDGSMSEWLGEGLPTTKGESPA